VLNDTFGSAEQENTRQTQKNKENKKEPEKLQKSEAHEEITVDIL